MNTETYMLDLINDPIAAYQEMLDGLVSLIQAECNRAKIEVCEAVLSASDKPKNKGFAGTWHGDMAAACGEVATQYKKAKRELQQLMKEGE